MREKIIHIEILTAIEARIIYLKEQYMRVPDDCEDDTIKNIIYGNLFEAKVIRDMVKQIIETN